MFFIVVPGVFISCENARDRYNEAALDSLLREAVANTDKLAFEKAKIGFSSVLNHARISNSKKYETLSLINLGVLYLKFNVKDEALQYFLGALQVAEDSRNDEYLNTIYNNIGVIYSERDASDAIDYFQKALAISIRQKNIQRTAFNRLNIGSELEKQGKFAAAGVYFKEGLRDFVVLRDTINQSVALNNVGELFMNEQLYDSAITNFKNALRLSVLMDDQYYRPQYHLNLARAFEHLGEHKQACVYATLAIQGFTRLHDAERVVRCHEVIGQAKHKMQDAEGARKNLEAAIQLQDSLLRSKTKAWKSELEMKYAFLKKEKEFEFLQKESERTKRYYLAVIIGGTLSVGLGIWLMTSRYKNLRQKNIILERDREVAALRLEKSQTELEQIQMKIAVGEKMHELERESLVRDLHFKERDLAAKALRLVNKSEDFAAINKVLAEIDVRDNPDLRSQVNKIKKVIEGDSSLESDWEGFKMHFEKVHPQFFRRLEETFPRLTPKDTRLCAYLVLDLSAKEIAQIFNISPESVRKQKQRLKEKLDLEQDDDIRSLLKGFHGLGITY
jgi:tetratricopeptide (TPR) repeat protein